MALDLGVGQCVGEVANLDSHAFVRIDDDEEEVFGTDFLQRIVQSRQAESASAVAAAHLMYDAERMELAERCQYLHDEPEKEGLRDLVAIASVVAQLEEEIEHPERGRLAL
jgi:hypothetical protein